MLDSPVLHLYGKKKKSSDIVLIKLILVYQKRVGSESPCRAELPTLIVYFSISSSVKIFQK